MMYEALIGLVGILIGYLVSFSIERVKTKNERGTHISKTRFDKEFEIYQELSEKNLTAVYDAGTTAQIVSGKYVYKPEDKTAHLEKFCKSMNDADFSNKRYAPFINKEIFQKYKDLESIIKEIYKLYHVWISEGFDEFKYYGEIFDKEKAASVISEKQIEASNLSDDILDTVRNYLMELDAIE